MSLLVVGALIGACLGSWLSVVWYRLPRRLSLVRPGSACPACQHELGTLENLPIVGYLLHGARCGHCHVRIPVRYLLLELSAAALGVVCVWWNPWGALGLALAVVIVPMLVSIARGAESSGEA